MVRCPQCGTSATGKFCPNCGAPLPQTPAPSSAPAQPDPTAMRKGGTTLLKWVGLGVGAFALMVIAVTVAGKLFPKNPTPVDPSQLGNSWLQPPSPSSQPTTPTPAPSQGNSGQKAAANPDAQYFVSRWRCWSFGGGNCPVGWEQLIIKADGTYTLADNPGTWKIQNGKAVFDGPLAFAGAATPKPPDQFQLDYNDKSGFGTYILFVKW